MKRNIILLCAVFLALPLAGLAFSGSEVHITKDGLATITDTKVLQIAGSTFFTRMYWGDSYVRLTVKTNSNTKFYRGTGELTTVAEISDGDLLDVSGQLSGGDVLNLIATSVKNSSVQKKQTFFSGSVQSVDLGKKSFVINDKKVGLVTVLATSTTRFVKGNRTLDLAHLLSGDTISKVSGDYNITTKTLIADVVLTYIDLNNYKPRNFQGILKEINTTVVPVEVKVSIDGKLYDIKINNKTTILNKLRNSVSLNRFVAGDTIRIFGSIREVDEAIIDAEIVRNISL